AETHFLDSAALRESLSVSDFTFETLKSEPTSIYLVLPADRLHPFANWLRLMIQQAITVNARNVADQPEHPVLFVLDEMAALGRLPIIEQAYGLMAGFGMQLLGVVQDLSQLERHYGKGWQSFIANAGVVSYFGSSDRMTAEYFSAMCGETTVWTLSSALSRAIGHSSGTGGVTSSDTLTTSDTRAATQRKLAYPDELMRLHEDKMLVFVENMPPIIAFKRRWYETRELAERGVNLHAQ
ncbi:MAG: type IV secretory system conjugative DNA transfer family protein, partial [Sphingomonadales bacterium]